MSDCRDPQPLDLAASPEEVLAAWPADVPLAALWSGQTPGRESPWSRWTILARPVATLRISQTPRGPRVTVRGEVPGIARGAELPADPLAAMEAVMAGARVGVQGRGVDGPPFRGGWIGNLAYELGYEIEPASRPVGGASGGEGGEDRGWPLAEWHHCPAALVHDARSGGWWAVGEARGREELAAGACRGGGVGGGGGGRRFEVGRFRSATGREGYERAVARGIGHIEAGDVFQVNLAHRLSAGLEGSARGVFLELAARARPWYGAYIERPRAAEEDGARRIIASVSPELFLDIEGVGGGVVTRPIKGTRPGGAEERELRESGKDSAELTMIVDLMRNDLGRVCRVGSVCVEELRAIERHGGAAATGVLHGVATVRGVLREDVGVAGVLRAALAPGSVTGAPKIRAMQIIGELEPVARGPYCGAIGYVSDCGRAGFNVAIRTACITGRAAGSGAVDEVEGGMLDYHVGAGIVAESDPAGEWQETLDKAAAVLALGGALEGVLEGVLEGAGGRERR